MDPFTITYLEMRSAAQLRPRVCTDPRFRILEAVETQWRFNRFLYQLVGREWFWTDRLPWTDAQWQAYAEDPALRTWVAYHDGAIAGYFELRSEARDVEVAYFGLTREFIGRGLGGALLTRALEEAWRSAPDRVWVHTCTLDHPAALANYQARGMVVCKTEVVTS